MKKSTLAGLREVGLTDVEVRNRFVYEASQIKAFFETEEIPGLKEIIEGHPVQNHENLINQMTNECGWKCLECRVLC